MRRSTSLLAVASLALAGCVAGPPPEIATPVPELPNEFIYSPETDEAANLAQLLPAYDPAFTVFAELALQDAPSLAEALARVDAARASASGAGAARLASVGASASVTANRTNPAQFGVDLPGGAAFDTERTSYAGNLSLIHI